MRPYGDGFQRRWRCHGEAVKSNRRARGISARYPARPWGLWHGRVAMAIMRFRRTVYKSGGGTSRARIEYVTRQRVGELKQGEQQLRYLQEGREDLVYTNS